MNFDILTVVILAMGLFLGAVAIYIWAKRRLDLVHGENVKNIKKEYIEPYSRAMGLGLLIISVSVIAYALISAVSVIPIFVRYIVLIAGATVGAVLIFTAKKKYYDD